MLPAVRTRRATTVVPLPSAGGVPTTRCRRVPLSPLDTRWVALPPTCHVYLFPAAAAAAQVPFSDVVRALTSSLSAVLPAFHPLAGEVAYAPELGTVAIACGGQDDAGVALVESETDLDFARLVAGLDDDALPQLVPDIRREELPAPVFAAQVTEFVGGSGGIALGVALNHVAMDGIGFFRFMEMWAAASAAASGASSDGTTTEPLHDRRLVRFDGDEELAGRLLRQVAPDLPRVMTKQRGPTPQRQLLLSRRTFTFFAHALRRLKQRLTAARPEFAAGAAAPSLATLAAHGWVCLALANGFTDAAPVFAVFASDCRAHMSPPVPDAYAGNCVASCVVALSGAELTGADGPALAFLVIRDAVTKAKQDPLLVDTSSLITKIRAIPPGRKVLVAGSPWFPAYAVDFGFGRPSRVERASLDQDGIMAVYAGREAGSVQVSVAIAAEKMSAFQRMFAVKSGSNKARL